MDEDQEASQFRVHDVLYVDFLGFADRVRSVDERGLNGLVRLLESISEARQQFDLKGEAEPDGGYKIRINPEITTFSDHVVVSFPSEPQPNSAVWKFIRDGWIDTMHHQMQRITASLALGALELDMLIRGGLSRGQLVHHQAVVIGKALIDAYELESETAVISRVAVSKNIELSARISVERDGVRCLDYMTELMLQAEERFGDVRTWTTEIIRRIDLRLPHMNDRQAAKWRDFRARLDHQRITWPTQS